MAHALRLDTETIRAWSAHAAQAMRESLRRFGGEVVAAWRGLSLLMRLLLGAAVLLVLAVFIFLAQPNWNWARGAVSALASARLNRPVSIGGDLRVHLFSFTPSAVVKNVRVGQPGNFVTDAPKDDLAHIDGLSASVQLLPLLVGHVVLPRVQADKPDVVLFQDAAGHANWDFSNDANKGQAAHLPLIKNFIIHDGHIRLQSLSRGMRFSGTVEAHEKADAGGQAFGLTGDGSLNGKDFTIKASGGPLLNVHSGTPYPFDMTVRAGGTQIVAKGKVLHPFDLGQLQGAVTVSGGNLADLYYLTGLTLPDTPAYRLSAQVRRADRTYHIDGIDGRVGHSDLEGALKVVLGRDGRPDLSGDLTSKRLDFKDLGALFGATSANAPQGATVTLNPEPTAAARRLLPDVPLDAARVRGMDADVHYRAQSVNASPNLPLRGVDLGVKLDHGLMRLDPIAFQFPQGRLKGTAKIDARDRVQQNSVDFTVSDIAVQQFTPEFQGAEPIEGRISARLNATGGGATVHDAASTANGRFALVMSGGTVRQSLAELMGVDATKGLFMLLAKDPHQTDVRCAVADFTIRHGVMTAQRIVFDTGVVVVNGSGRIDMKDESLKLVFKGKAKKFRLVHLNAPIVIGGHLTRPSFGVDPGPTLAQGGVGAALGALSGGLAVLPFLNLNGASDANCAALEAAAHQHGAPKP